MMSGIPYNMSRGPSDPISGPPADMANVTLSYFPLRADPVALADFVDSYLNIMPPEIARFEVLAPFVLLYAADFQTMTGRSLQMGLASEDEVGFMVPLAWYRREGGKEVLQSIALMCPYIYVNEERPVLDGREVYGWPKAFAWFEPMLDHSVRNPDAARILFRLQKPLIAELWSGQRTENVDLLEVTQARMPSLLQWPLSPAANPFRLLTRMVDGLYTAATEGVDVVEWLWQSQQLDDTAALIARVLCDLWRQLLRPTVPRISFPLINLKQFRDIERNQEICYQSIVNSPMTLTRLKGFGLLGEQAILSGDLSGGCTVRLSRYDAQPVFDTLGLEAQGADWGRSAAPPADSWVSAGPPGNTSLHDLGRPSHRGTLPKPPVALLKPVLPFWIRVDLRYEAGEHLCRRTRNSDWCTPDGTCYPRPKTASAGAPTTRPAQPPGAGNPYNTSRGGAVDVVSGPFHLTDVTFRIMPLVADAGRLGTFCDNYLNITPEKGGDRFVPWGDRVYLMATDFGRVVSRTQNIGSWARHEIKLCFPALWSRGEKFLGAVMVAPYVFSDSEISTFTSREIFGWPTLMARVESPPATWLDHAGPGSAQPLLHLWSSVYPAMNLAQAPKESLLIEVIRSADDVPGSKSEEDDSPSDAIGESNENVLVAAAREILQGRMGLDFVSLKQFREAGLVNDACYQAIVMESAQVCGAIEPIASPVEVRIHQNPNLPMVERLGLVPDRVKVEKSRQQQRVWQGGETAVFENIEPSWMQVSMRTGRGARLAWRAARDPAAGDPMWCQEAVPQRRLDFVDGDANADLLQALHEHDPMTILNGLHGVGDKGSGKA